MSAARIRPGLLAALLFAALVAAAVVSLIVVEDQRDRPPIPKGAEGTRVADAL